MHNEAAGEGKVSICAHVCTRVRIDASGIYVRVCVYVCVYIASIELSSL